MSNLNRYVLVLESAFNSDGVDGMARATHRLMDDIHVPETVACEKGCAWCCRDLVFCSPAEGRQIAQYLIQNYSSAVLDDIEFQLGRFWRAMKNSSGDLNTFNHTGLACPFLSQDKSCRVYPVRPAQCRQTHSLDPETCRQRAISLMDGGPPVSVLMEQEYLAATAEVISAEQFAYNKLIHRDRSDKWQRTLMLVLVMAELARLRLAKSQKSLNAQKFGRKA